MGEKIYSLILSIRNPDVPFVLERSIGVESGDLLEVFARFQLELVRFVREMHEEKIKEIERKLINDDIPF